MVKKEADKIADLPHIVLRPIEGQRIRGVGMAITSRLYKPISQQDFINKINQAIEINSVKLYSKTNTYMLIDLTVPYYNNDVFLMLKKLHLALKSVIDNFQILVATDVTNLTEYIKKEKIPQNVLNVIKDIKKLESSYKIGKSLQETIRKDVDKKVSLNVMMRLIENIEDEEQRICLTDLKSMLVEEKAVTFYPFSLTVSCSCSTTTIQKVAELPFIKLVTEMPKTYRKIQKSAEISDLKLYNRQDVKILEAEDNLPIICIIDSGISSILSSLAVFNDPFNFFDLSDTIQHGTEIASVCLFGEDLLEKKKVLNPKSKIISVKLDDISIPEDKIMIEEAIIYSIKKYKHLTSIFNLSYNYYDVPEEQRLEIVKRIDQFIQKENVILVNSAGNIFNDAAYYLRDKYPDYLTKNPVFCPADGRNVFSVGSLSSKSTQNSISYSRHTRIGIHPIYQNEEIDKYDFIKPEIHTYGGDCQPNDLQLRNIVTPEEGFPVLSHDGNIIYSAGTSFSAPLVSLCLARLYQRYKKILKNSETYKAMLINKCQVADCKGYTTFSLLNTKGVAECNDGVYINFEGESYPHEKAENMSRKKIIKCKKIDFYMPQEAESLDVVVVHSNNYPEQNIKDFKTKVILKFTKPQGTVCKKEYGNIGRKSALTYAHYTFNRGYEGQWNVDLHIETSGIPAEIFNDIKIRFGVSIRINLKTEYKKDLREIYLKVFEKTKSSKLIELESQIEIPVTFSNAEVAPA